MSEPMIYGAPKALAPIKEVPGIPYEYVFVYDYRKLSALLARATEALDKIGSIDPRDVEFIRKVREELKNAHKD